MSKSIIALMLICIFSCQEKIQHQTPEVFKVPLEQSQISVKENFKEIKYLRLIGDGGLYPSKIDQLEFLDDEIYILDRSFGVIFKFSAEGHLISKLDKLGEGPGEYQYPHRFLLDKKNGSIEIYDKVRKRILVYDKNFNFLETINIDLFFKDFVKLGHMKYLLFLGQENQYANEMIQNNLIVWNKGIIEYQGIQRLPTDQRVHKRGIAKVSNRNSDENLVYLTQSYNDTLYVYSDGENKISKKVIVDFGTDKFNPSKERGFLTMEDIERESSNHSYSTNLDALFINENFETFSYSHYNNGITYSNVFYHFPKTGKILTGNGLRNDIDGFNLFSIIQVKDSYLVTSLNSEYLLKLDFEKASLELNQVMDFSSSFEDQIVLVFLKFNDSLTGLNNN